MPTITRTAMLPCLMLAALTACLALAPAALAADAPADPIEMVYPGDDGKFAPIVFEHHEQHLSLDKGCQACHHTWTGEGEVQGCRVEGCHSDTSRANKKEPTSYDSAFHARTSEQSCVGCHTAVSQADPAMEPPRSCGDCHTKK